LLEDRWVCDCLLSFNKIWDMRSLCVLLFGGLLIIRIETDALLHQNNRGRVILLLDMLAMLLIIFYNFFETNMLLF
jgi:hypothetical protein